MIEIEINKQNLKKFIDDIKLEDKKELEHFFKEDFKEEFIKLALLNKDGASYFLADDDLNPIFIGGVVSVDKKANLGQVWLLSTNKVNNHKLFVYRYVKDKIKLFQRDYNILFNYIYKSNFKALKWLKKCGFKVKKTNDKNYKLFYFNKGENNFDI